VRECDPTDITVPNAPRRIRRRQSGQRPVMFCAVACRARQCCARRARRSASRWSSTALSCDPPALPPVHIERRRRRRRRQRRMRVTERSL
jgi:hypothetical protein